MPNFSLSDAIFEDAAARFPTPFHLYDETGIRARARALLAAFSWCPDFHEYFAVKALPNPAILRIMREEGCGLDCSSLTELLMSERGAFITGSIKIPSPNRLTFPIRIFKNLSLSFCHCLYITFSHRQLLFVLNPSARRFHNLLP